MSRVCIVGAGSSGIAAVKALKDAAVDFDCFELCSVVGGNWAFGSAWSAAYRTLHINSYCREMEYADFPMPANASDYPHHEEIAAYFNAYVDHFGLRPFITFDTPVERARPKPGGGWKVQLATGEERDYGFLVVATGHHHTPRWPEPAFPGHFDGLQMHSHDYRDMSDLAAKNVIVLGMGNSAMDIAVESSYVARHTYLASRRGAYVIPKYFFGRPGLPIPPWFPWQVRQLVLQQAVRVAVGPVERFGLPPPLAPHLAGPPDRIGRFAQPAGPRGHRGQTEHRRAVRPGCAVRGRQRGRCGRDRLLHRLPDPLPLLRRVSAERRRQRITSVRPYFHLIAGRPGPCGVRPTLGVDHAGSRSASQAGSRPANRPVCAARYSSNASRCGQRPAGHGAALRRLQASHDPDRHAPVLVVVASRA